MGTSERANCRTSVDDAQVGVRCNGHQLGREGEDGNERNGGDDQPCRGDGGERIGPEEGDPALGGDEDADPSGRLREAIEGDGGEHEHQHHGV